MENQNMNEDSDTISTDGSQETETVQIKIFKNPTIQKVISHFEGVVAEKERLFENLYKDYYDMVDEMNDWKTKCLDLQQELESSNENERTEEQLDHLITLENEEKEAKTLVWDILCELKNGWCVDSKLETGNNVSSPRDGGKAGIPNKDTSKIIEKVKPMVEKLFDLIENENSGEQLDGNEKDAAESNFSKFSSCLKTGVLMPNPSNESSGSDSPGKTGSNQNLPCNEVTLSNRESDILSASESDKAYSVSTRSDSPQKDSSSIVPTTDHQMTPVSVYASSSLTLDRNKLLRGLRVMEHSETQTPESWLARIEPFHLIDSGSQTVTNTRPYADKWLQTPRHWVCNHLHSTPPKVSTQGNEIYVETVSTQTDDQWNPKSDAIYDTTFEALTTENDATLADNNSSNLASPVTDFGTSSSASNIASKDGTSGQADTISADSNTNLNQTVFKRESDIVINYTQVEGSEYGFTEYGEDTPTPGGFTFASESETIGRSERFFNVDPEVPDRPNPRSPFHKIHDTCRSNHGRRQKCKFRKNSIRENIIASQSVDDMMDSSSNKQSQYKDVFLCQPERRRGRKVPHYDLGKARSESVLNKSVHDLAHNSHVQTSRSDSKVTVSTPSEKSLAKAHSNESSQSNSNSKVFEDLMHSDTNIEIDAEKIIEDSLKEKEKEKSEVDSDTATLGGEEVNLCDVENEDEVNLEAGGAVENNMDILKEEQDENNPINEAKTDENLETGMIETIQDKEIQNETTDIKMQSNQEKKSKDGRNSASKMSQKSVNSPSPRNKILNKDSRPNSRTNSRPTSRSSRQERSSSRKGKSSPKSAKGLAKQSQAEKKISHDKDGQKGVKKSPPKKEGTIKNEISKDEVEIIDQNKQNSEILGSNLQETREDKLETPKSVKSEVENNETPRAKKSRLKPSKLPRLSPQNGHTAMSPSPQKPSGKPPSKQVQKSQNLKTSSPSKGTGKIKNESLAQISNNTKLSPTPPKSGGRKIEECAKHNEGMEKKQNLALSEGDKIRSGKDSVISGKKFKPSEKARSDTSVEQNDARKKSKKSETRGGQTSHLKVASSTDGLKVKARGKDSTAAPKTQPVKRDIKKK